MTRARPLWLAALAAALAAAPCASHAQSSRLEQLRSEIEAREAKAKDLGKQAEGYLGEIEAVDRELTETKRSARLLRGREKEAGEELAVARRGVDQSGRALAEIERGLDARLVALYKWDASGGQTALVASGDFMSLTRRREGLARILAEDRALFARVAAARADYQASRERSETLLKEVGEARAEAAGREQKARERLIQRRNLVAALRTRAAREEKAARELRTAAAHLEETLRSMPTSPAPSRGTGLARGATPRPVAGRVRAGFGRQVDKEFKTETLRTGIEITAPAGAPVAAIAPGRVLFAGWFRGYGQMVILDHGGGDLSVSGYLDEVHVAAGDRVSAGQTIGSVGETGSASGPGLYFEIRHDGKAVDPTLWLAK
ncbi:MAG TPA: peptidoglycan DD-metalloendopeptidase family protein [Myxococcota bacterium]|nr:peptidoglycan DD-metalloendopeptidase family protein [Myxococcota bacterium]